MAPRKYVQKRNKNVDGKIVKRGRNKKTYNQNAPPLIRIEVPTETTSTSGTKNSNTRVVITPNVSKDKIVSANEAGQAHIGKKPINIVSPSKQPNMKGNPVPENMMDRESLGVKKKITPVSVMDSDVVQAHFRRNPMNIVSQTKQPNMKRKPVPAKIIDGESLSVTPVSVMDSDAVQAHFGKSPINIVSQTKQPKTKRKPIHETMIDGESLSVKKKITPVSSMDSNGPAFEETSEPKRKKSRPKGWKNKNEENSMTTDADICKNNTTKRLYLPKLGANKTNQKIKRKVPQSCRMALDESKSRKRIGKREKASVTILNNEHLETTMQHSECEDILSKKPAQIGPRKTSVTSETLSWTKDITSSSTTCLTVCTNDFVRFDNKLPFVKLTNICNELNEESINRKKGETLTDSDSTDEMVSITDENVSSAPLSRGRSLSLSSSSSCPTSSKSDGSVPGRVLTRRQGKICDAVDMLTSELNNLDLEIMSWIGYEERNEIKRNFQDKLFNVLNEEGDAILLCQNVQRILLDDDSQLCFSPGETKKNSKTDEQSKDFVRPRTVSDANDLDNSEKAIASVNENVHNENARRTDGLDSNLLEDKCNDDDDALSLFAESISGFESYRKSSTVTFAPTENNEYIPQPITKNKTGLPIVTYKPTKINAQKKYEDDVQIQKNQPVFQNKDKLYESHQKTKTVCEKQNADSTSIYKETEHHERNLLRISDESINFDETHEQSLSHSSSTPQTITKNPTLIASRYKPMNCVKSVVFTGVCFFNLANNCHKSRCRFVHAHLDIDVVKSKLSQLNEELFIQEYMILRLWAILRRKYGLLYVLEAINRNLTAVVIEMAIDFVTKTNSKLKEDVNLKVDVLEMTLLHLNNVDILTCADLLRFDIKNGECICDIFMQTLAETQNFSRFKTVFINLTNFMYQIPRKFCLDVASSLLERVCILPFEKPLALALLKVLKSTSPDILKNSMFNQFEELLSRESKELYDQLREFKIQIAHKFSLVISAATNNDLEQINSIVLGETEKRCSPDTTNFDYMAKTYKEPVEHSVDSNRLRPFEQTRGTINDTQTSLVSPHNIQDSQRVYHQRWDNKSKFNKTITINNTNADTPILLPNGRPRFKRHLDEQRVRYGNSLPKYPRRFGPNFK